MGKGAPGNIVLIGFSFTGKTAVGREVARTLGLRFVDSDDEIAALAGKDIPQIFAQDGEARFRELERQVLARLCREEGLVISTGGGAIVDAGNRELLAGSGVVVLLEATPLTIYQRLRADQEPGSVPRPLLAAADPLGRIEEMKVARQPFYAMADWTVHTDTLSPDEVCQEVVRAWRHVSQRWDSEKRLARPFPPPPGDAPEGERGASFTVSTPTSRYPVFVGWGILDELGERLKGVGLGGTAFVISDEAVFALHGQRTVKALEGAGLTVASLAVPPGEKSKAIEGAVALYDWLVARHAERGHTIVALGGGMVGDLAGFVAATFLRGLPLVQVPTTLIAMADSAIGGKVAINHPQAKNLIGAFYQPRLVLADTGTLATLPARELTSGWAEVAKHALALDADLFAFLDAGAARLVGLDAEATAWAVKRSAAIKAAVVAEDEREQGRRTILNYGHTIAHGLEVATGYGHLLHGEAVAIGMMGAAMLSERLGLITGDVVEQQRGLLERLGLPTSCPGAERDGVLSAMELDKKVRQGAVRWVLLEGIGRAVVRADVPVAEVRDVLDVLLK
ncbi:MAG: 3-dehydroquinate synthase [Chloroflexota bacterium]|nr:3-dehydroquinate synthase [Chloroflexota bacterium]